MRSRGLAVLALALECCQQALRCQAEDEGTCPAGSPDCGLGEGGGDEARCDAWARSCECQLDPEFMLRHCAQSCRLHGGHCVDKDASCQRVALGKRCTPDQWGACPKLCKLHRAERRRIREGGKKTKKKLEGSSQIKEEKVKCVRKETRGGLQDTSVATMFERIEQSEWAKKYEPTVLSRDPWVIHFGRLLTEQQVADLRAVAEDSRYPWEPSGVTGGPSVEGYRTSESMSCTSADCQNDMRARQVHLVAMNITGLGLPTHEFMQMVRYKSGTYYNEHFDTDGEFGSSAPGHRIYTMLTYLSTVPDGFGGETSFPRLNLTVPPRRGSAVLWTNVRADNPRKRDDRAKHASLPEHERARRARRVHQARDEPLVPRLRRPQPAPRVLYGARRVLRGRAVCPARLGAAGAGRQHTSSASRTTRVSPRLGSRWAPPWPQRSCFSVSRLMQWRPMPRSSLLASLEVPCVSCVSMALTTESVAFPCQKINVIQELIAE
ncbi:unnamed protein product [Prorocentrum cordatum]|uniref:Fe2OG dioxygenase domain-containing protein n=1 Tax=Prorocentrum cordatum TaxID=2364126 RepID=A0ABN9TEF7_9DINO|nr:unnamed protein product [Polarella glacialis]CAK0843981.1 unnamed protein product [Polarella glacialis]